MNDICHGAHRCFRFLNDYLWWRKEGKFDRFCLSSQGRRNFTVLLIWSGNKIWRPMTREIAFATIRQKQNIFSEEIYDQRSLFQVVYEIKKIKSPYNNSLSWMRHLTVTLIYILVSTLKNPNILSFVTGKGRQKGPQAPLSWIFGSETTKSFSPSFRLGRVSVCLSKAGRVWWSIVIGDTDCWSRKIKWKIAVHSEATEIHLNHSSRKRKLKIYL